MKTIAIIIPWFGPWPFWKDLFFQSCKKNDTIDFFFISDQEKPESVADGVNIHFHCLSFESYCAQISQKLNIDFRPQRAYKLCDLKPFYGIVHAEQIEKYDFWGYGDLDLVWGDIRSFYTDEVLENYDVLSTHGDRLSGHLTLLRNKSEFTNACLRIPGWEKNLTVAENLALDEQHFTRVFYPKVKLLWKVHKHIFLNLRGLDEWTLYNRFCSRFNRWVLGRRYLFKEQNTTPWAEGHWLETHWLYRDGHITNQTNGEELIYLHFLSMKKKMGENDTS